MNEANLEKLIALMKSPQVEGHFDMTNYSHLDRVDINPGTSCGIACCLGGWVTVALLDKNTQGSIPGIADASKPLAMFLEIPKEASDSMAYPSEWGLSAVGWRATPAQAVRMLEIFRDTGKVDWAIACGGAEE